MLLSYNDLKWNKTEINGNGFKANARNKINFFEN